MIYEQSLVSKEDLSQVKRAFDLNGYVGILYFVTTAVAVYVELTSSWHLETNLDKSPGRIAGMFDAIAPRYDLLNTVLSGGSIATGGARAIGSLGFTGHETLLDVCTGTGDVALAAARPGRARRVLGVDFAGAMLTRAVEKGSREAGRRRVHFVRGDAMNLPVAERDCGRRHHCVWHS